MSIPFVSQPGAEFHYSGQGLQVLGRIIEWLSRMRLDKAMVARALAPLGIQHHAQLCYLAPQTFSAISAGLASRSHTFIPSPYDDKQRACLSWAAKPNDNLYGQQWGQADSCGASMLSAINLLRFVTFCTDLLGNDLMSEALTPPKTPPYTNGLGWGVSINKGRYQYGHSGAITGMRTMCESMSNGVQYAVIAAGDRDNEFNSILKAVRDLGHSLRKGDLDIGDWQAYGFQ
jgi:CubicO group peptidase (beta-lactamase class C family)